MAKKINQAALVFLIAICVQFLAKLADDPSFHSMSLDGAAFAYCGERITQGALLYRDCWDNKPPAIYYLNAAVLAIGGTNSIYIWFFQTIWLALTAVVLFSVLRSIWNNRLAVIATTLMLLTLLHPIYLSGGNLTETYALLPISLVLGSFYWYLKNNKTLYLLGTGFFTALAFLFKPTYISMGIAAILILMVIRLRQRKALGLARELGLVMVSFVVPLLLVAAYWAAQHDLTDMLYAVFVHNQLYVERGFSLRSFIITLRIFIIEQPIAALFALAMISILAWIIEKWDSLWQSRSELSANQNPETLQVWVMATLVIAFIFDYIAIALPGTSFRHYYQIPILTLAALTAYLFSRVPGIKLSVQKRNANGIILYSAIILFMLPWLVEVIGKEVPSKANWKAFFANPNITRYQPSALEEFILENTTPDQSIFIWDYNPAIYLHVNRKSPTRFIFLRHLFTPIPRAKTGFAELMADLQKDPPELIISSKNSQQGLPYLGQDVRQICSDCSTEVTAGVVALKQYLTEYYQAYMDIENWAIYKRLK